MERCTVRLFSGIGILVLLVSFAEVLARSVQPAILDAMKSDENLQNLPKYISNTSLTRACSTLRYPEDEDITPKLKNEDIFLCLGVYDAWYKISQYLMKHQYNSPFDNTAEFDAHIRALAPGKSKEEVEKFCETLKGYTPMYNRTKPFVTSLSTNILDDVDVCRVICVDIDKTFNPLCGILAWVKTVDEDIKNQAVITAAVQVSSAQTNHVDKVTNVISPDKAIVENGSELKNKETENKDAEEGKKNNKVKAYPSSTNTANSAEHADANTQKETDTKTSSSLLPKAETQHATLKNKSETLNKKPETLNKGTIVVSKGSVSVTEAPADPIKKIQKLVGKDVLQHSEVEVKPVLSSTISENTQDHIDVATSDDFNRMDVEQPDDLDNSINPPEEAGDQNENLPEPSGPRDMMRHPGIAPDEEPHFLTYLSVISLACIVGYIVYHNKQKILAIVLEGRRSRNSRGRRRPSTASYRKLDCTLEEAVTSQCNANVTHVIY